VTATRRAPAGGYDFAEKRQYRRQIWNVFERYVPKPPKTTQVMLMPSTEGLEIQVATEKGFRVSNMHVVDSNPAIVATLRRRYPNLRGTYGVEIGDACIRAGLAGVRVHALNLDLTSCFSRPTARTLGAAATSGALSDVALVGVTMLRGREGAGIYKAVRSLGGDLAETWLPQRVTQVGPLPLLGTDWGRIGKAWECLATVSGFHVLPLKCGAYQSGTQTMLWVVFHLQREAPVWHTAPGMLRMFPDMLPAMD
jgi:hypothetical protein